MKYAIWVSTLLFATIALAADEDRRAADEGAIRKAVESYVAAFNRGDAKGLAALWAPEAVYTSPAGGEPAVGREAIEKQFAALFAEVKNAKLEAKTRDIQFVSPNVAIEHGTAKVIRPDQSPEETEYSAVYMKRDGQWLLDRIEEEETVEVQSNYERLKELEWMIGTWVDQDDVNRIETDCQWTKNRNFISRSFAISIRDKVEMSGMQIIGWDADQKRIRSWVFDSDGGFGEGVWSKKDKRWYIHNTGTMPDGRKTSSVNIITYVDKDRHTWQSVDRVVDGELLPNVDEVIVVRQEGEQ
jgi:uncharacterized protein (TIGR02246 family)